MRGQETVQAAWRHADLLDEMNLHAPISMQTMSEVQLLENVNDQIIHPKTSSPILTLVQDSAIGVYLLSQPEVKFNVTQMMNMMASNKNHSMILPPADKDGLYSGRQLISTAMPPFVNTRMDMDIGFASDTKNNIVVENGELLSGFLNKSVYSSMTNGLIHQCFNYGGSLDAANLLNNTQALTGVALKQIGFSVGIDDMIISQQTQNEIDKALDEQIQKVDNLMDKVIRGQYVNMTTKSNRQALEEEITTLLNANKTVEEILKRTIDQKNNRIVAMVDSGAKGKKANLILIKGYLGQQTVAGGRQKDGYKNRTIPHEMKYDYSAQARGFVRSSYLKGLNPKEYYYHTVAGREGLIDTSVKTSDTGYMQRRMVKALEDCRSEFNGSIKFGNWQIVQFLYGGDGAGCTNLEKHVLKYVQMQHEQLEKTFKVKKNDYSGLNKYDIDQLSQHYQDIINDSEYIATKVNIEGKLMYPVNFQFLIDYYAQGAQRYINKQKSNLVHPLYVLYCIDHVEKNFLGGKYHLQNNILGILLRYYLSPKKIINRFTHEKFNELLTIIVVKLKNSMVQPKENVGVIAAQSMGESSSQLVLNTFHLAGQATASQIVRGVPRLKELLQLSESIKTPQCIIYLEKEYAQDPYKAGKVKNKIELRYVRDIIQKAELVYSRKTQHDFFKRYGINILPDVDKYQYILYLYFNRELMANYELKMIDVKSVIVNTYSEYAVECLSSDDNEDILFIQIRYLDRTKEDDDLTNIKALQEKIIETVVLKGIQNIQKAIHRKQEKFYYDTKKRQTIKEFEQVIETQGSNIKQLILLPEVDYTRIYSNNVIEMMKTFGIEVARMVLLNEINETFAAADINVLSRHVELLVDWMCYRGIPMSVHRTGINKQKNIGVMAKATFEQTAETIVKAAIYQQKDLLSGSIAPIILGQQPKNFGTSATQIYYNF